MPFRGAFPSAEMNMPNDARLGLVLGVGLVIAVAVIFFPRDLITRKPLVDPAAASTIRPVKPPVPAAPRGTVRPAKARATSQTGSEPAEVRPTGKEGEGP